MKKLEDLVVIAAIVLFGMVRPAFAQGTAFTYQGRLNDGANPAAGVYDLRFAIYDSTNLPGVVIAGPLTNSATAVSNGLFAVMLDFGAGVFTGPPRWLEIGVRTNGGAGFATLAPRQALTPTPYAVMAGSASNLLGTLSTAQLTGTFPAGQLSGTIPSANLSGSYGNAVSFNNGSDSFDGTFTGQFFGSSFFGGSFNGNFFGDGGGLYNLNASQLASGTVPDARLGGNVVRTNQVWLLGGNPGTNPNTNFIGTTDNQPLIIKVNGQEAERFEPATNSPNIVGGYAGNSVGGVVAYGVTIGGGGQSNIANTIQGNNVTFATISGGAANLISGINAYHSVIGGGTYNTIFGDNAFQATIAGGSGNTVQAWASAVGGGTGNLIQPGADHSTIAGGYNNWVLGGGWDSVIAGGYGSVVQSNSQFTVIGGGEYNTNGSSLAFIGGGSAHLIQYNCWGAFIGGGYQNIIQSGSGYSAIGSGYQNSILTNASFSFIGGGSENVIQVNSPYAAIGGGFNNQIGADAKESMIGGGEQNSIQGDAHVLSTYGDVSSTIAGGERNTIQTNSAWSIIGGGILNQIQPYALGATVGGGYANIIQGNSNFWAFFELDGSTIGGGAVNTIQTNAAYSTIAGGLLNVIQANASWSSIGGGVNNVNGAASSTIGGGWGNIVQTNASDSTIGGGNNNVIQAGAGWSVIAGGSNNIAGGNGATVPGGLGNTASGMNSFAAGTDAQATNDGAFVLTDDQPTNFYSTASNQLSARFTGGVRFVTGGAGMTLDGLSILSGGVNAGQLSGPYTNAVALTNAGNSFAGNGAGLTNVNAALLNGLPATAFAPASGSPNYIQNQNLGFQAASFQITGSATVSGAVAGTTLIASNAIVSGAVTASSLVASNAQFTGLIRSGSETGASNPPSPDGLVIRRINSLANAVSNVVARTDVLTLERDGSNEGLLIRYPAGVSRQTINCLAQTLGGTNVIVHATLNGPVSAGTIQLLTGAQHAVHASISFGNTYNSGQVTEVVLDRYDDGSTSDFFWVGTLTSTYNQ